MAHFACWNHGAYTHKTREPHESYSINHYLYTYTLVLSLLKFVGRGNSRLAHHCTITTLAEFCHPPSLPTKWYHPTISIPLEEYTVTVDDGRLTPNATLKSFCLYFTHTLSLLPQVVTIPLVLIRPLLAAPYRLPPSKCSCTNRRLTTLFRCLTNKDEGWAIGREGFISVTGSWAAIVTRFQKSLRSARFFCLKRYIYYTMIPTISIHAHNVTIITPDSDNLHPCTYRDHYILLR